MTLGLVSQSVLSEAGGDPDARRDALVALFEHGYAMTGEEARALASRCDLRLLSDGESIVREAEQATTVHWIVAGRASVYRHTHREGVLALLDLEPGEVVGEIAFLREDPDALYSATVRACESALVASASFASLRSDPALESARIRLVESFARIAAKRLTATSALTAEAMSTGLWRERRLALHLSSIIAVLALFVVLSNSLDFLRKLASTRMSDAAFLTGFYFAYDTALGVMFFWLIRTLQEPATALGLQFTGWPRQVAAGLVWSVPALAGAAALRAWLHPDEQLLSIYALSGGRGFLSPGALAGLVAYVLYLCPVQEYITRAGVQAPIMNAFGARLSGVGAVVSTLVAAILFGAMHVGFGVAAVLITTLAGLYWGIVFVRSRSVLVVAVSHMAVGVASFYWFGLIR